MTAAINVIKKAFVGKKSYHYSRLVATIDYQVRKRGFSEARIGRLSTTHM